MIKAVCCEWGQQAAHALFWESEKHCDAGENTRFSFSVEVTSNGLCLTNLKYGMFCHKAVLKSTAAGIAARKKDTDRRNAQLAGRSVTAVGKIERTLLPCMFPVYPLTVLSVDPLLSLIDTK